MPKISPIPELKLSPVELFRRLPQDLEGLCLLLSDGSKGSRWSIITANPVERTTHGTLLNEHWNSKEEVHELPFLGGWIGSVNYELGYEFLELPPEPGDHLEFSRYDAALIYDHHQQSWTQVGEINWLILDEVEPEHEQLSLEPSWTFERYQKAFEQIHENIRMGEIYQACLTFPFTGPAVNNPRDLFADLIKKNPSSMSVYMEQSTRTVMSLSPERFLVWDKDQLETMPIKGTRPRGETPAVDTALREELMADAKEQAELSMITDLLRNDLAKVSKPGTVEVMAHQELMKLPKVWHTYSHIRSQAREGLGPWDVIKNTLPGGSISGCPKRRAVEILREVEGWNRGLYTGCVGYISDHGRMDFNIAIRTLVQEHKQIKAGFGGGIVYDSVAEKEYEECFAKAKTFLS